MLIIIIIIIIIIIVNILGYTKMPKGMPSWYFMTVKSGSAASNPRPVFEFRCQSQHSLCSYFLLFTTISSMSWKLFSE